jgi:Zn-dependent alcohol dehydrogenase
MAITTRAAVMVEHNNGVVVEEIILDDPQGSEVLVKLFATGICHSQLHQLTWPHQRTPGILGHEGTGVVLKIGSDVTHLKEGDHCMLTWVPRDATPDSPAPANTMFTFRGEHNEAGNCYTWAEHALVDQQMVLPLPKDVTTASTSIVGCATVTGVGAVLNTADVQKGQSVAVIGVGGVGINVIAGAKIAGANPIIAVDLTDDKLEYAKKFGATHTVNASETDAVKAIQELTGGGADYAFDAIGGPVTTPQILNAVRAGATGINRGGVAVVVGMPQENFTINQWAFPIGEKSLIGSFGGSSHPDVDYPEYIEYFKNGQLPLDEMVTTTYTSLDDIHEGIRALAAGEIRGRSIIVFE